MLVGGGPATAPGGVRNFDDVVIWRHPLARPAADALRGPVRINPPSWKAVGWICGSGEPRHRGVSLRTPGRQTARKLES